MAIAIKLLIKKKTEVVIIFLCEKTNNQSRINIEQCKTQNESA